MPRPELTCTCRIFHCPVIQDLNVIAEEPLHDGNNPRLSDEPSERFDLQEPAFVNERTGARDRLLGQSINRAMQPRQLVYRDELGNDNVAPTVELLRVAVVLMDGRKWHVGMLLSIIRVLMDT